MSSKYYDRKYVFSSDFGKDDNIREMLINYNGDTPIFIIRFLMLIHQDKCIKIILELIKTGTEEYNDLVDCIISSSKLKLCEMQIFKSICERGCICRARVNYSKMYDMLISEIHKDSNVLLNLVFSNNLCALLRSTNAYEKNLYNILFNIAKTDRNNDMGVMSIIINGKLLSTNYKKIVEYIIANTDTGGMKNHCSKLLSIITKHNNRCSYIEDNVYISDLKFASNVPSIVDGEFTHVVSITRKKIEKKSGIQYYQIDIPDKASINFLNETSSTVEKIVPTIGTGKILCHCFSGISRSVLFTALLMSYHNKTSFIESLRLVKEHRKQANPNPELFAQVYNDTKNINFSDQRDQIIITD